jgi:hypothetical protein
MEDINTAHCSASSLYQGIKCIEQNACQLHHSHVVMHDLRCATCGGEVGAKGKRAPRNLTITASVIGGRYVHNPSFQGSKIGVHLSVIMLRILSGVLRQHLLS